MTVLTPSSPSGFSAEGEEDIVQGKKSKRKRELRSRGRRRRKEEGKEGGGDDREYYHRSVGFAVMS